MARRRWTQDKLMVEAPEMADVYREHITKAWDCVVEARESYLKDDWKGTDHWSREACLTAIQALVFSRGFKPAGEFPLRTARDYSYDTFGFMGDELFTRAELVGEFMPEDEGPDESGRRLFGKTVTAASSFVALVECQIAVERRPPGPPPDPHARRDFQDRLVY